MISSERISELYGLLSDLSPDMSLASQIIKIGEEYGEVCAAWVGYSGQNPRKGRTHTSEQVAEELADVAITAMLAIEALGGNAVREIDAKMMVAFDRYEHMTR